MYKNKYENTFAKEGDIVKIKELIKKSAVILAATTLATTLVTGCGTSNGEGINSDGINTSNNVTTTIDNQSANNDGSEVNSDTVSEANTTASQETDSGAQLDTESEATTNTNNESSTLGIDWSQVATPEMYPVYCVNEENTKLVGRTYNYDDDLWCVLSGSGVEFIYYGEKLDITFVTDSARNYDGSRTRVAVYIDDERVVDEMLDKASETFTAYAGNKKAMNVKVVKLSEATSSTFGISPITVADGEYIIPAEDKTHRIEFIGDSITCGYGVDDENKDHHFSTDTEDVTRAWAYKTAQSLGADYSIFSYSGWGIISGYTSNPSERSASQCVPAIYDQLAFSYQRMADSVAPQDIAWDFEQFAPEAIVINLGTNDASYCDTPEKREEYAQAYVDFLKNIRAHNADAYIFCVLGPMGDTMYASIKSAVADYTSETGDDKITSFLLPMINGSEGYAADWHPTEATHERVAMVAASMIKSTLGW